MHKTWLMIGAASVLACLAGCQVASRRPPKVGEFKLENLAGIEARMERVASADEGRHATRVTFTKTGEERRLLALETLPEGSPVGAKALALRYRVNLTRGESPRLVMLVYEKGGGVWYKISSERVAPRSFTEGRLPIALLRQAEFSQDASGALEWDKVEKICVGLVIDGPAQGSFEISQARFTSEPYKPTGPLRIAAGVPDAWNVGKDKAVQAMFTTPNEGQGGKPCAKFEFKFPGQRHMYAIPSTPVPEQGLEGYRALRFTYKASLPAGIKGLLVTLGEHGGGQYFADPAPPASADWTTITIPFENFKKAGWAKDTNEKLDLDQVDRLMIGVHGTASGAGGGGCIWVTDIEFVP